MLPRVGADEGGYSLGGFQGGVILVDDNMGKWGKFFFYPYWVNGGVVITSMHTNRLFFEKH